MCKEHITGCYAIRTVKLAPSLGLILTIQTNELCCGIYQPNNETPGHGLLYEITHLLFGTVPTVNFIANEGNIFNIQFSSHQYFAGEIKIPAVTLLWSESQLSLIAVQSHLHRNTLTLKSASTENDLYLNFQASQRMKRVQNGAMVKHASNIPMKKSR